jgi:dUTP pyrophosphatase
MSDGASGFDVVAAIDNPIILVPGARTLVPTGFCLEIPHGYEIQVRPRSGLALRYGITILNTPGTIDSDYRGEVKIILINLGAVSYTLNRGERIAQLVPAAVLSKVSFVEQILIAESARGCGGFGHTGK